MSIWKYTVGFVLSLLLSLAAYFYVVGHGSNAWLLPVLGVLALVQMIVQLLFFLHLGEETGPKYKLFSFLFMFGILIIVVGGSLWIMTNLNYNMMNMTPAEKTNYMSGANNMGF
jgi:cytochrome o ubiquinol oxidase operon protein cyoD